MTPLKSRQTSWRIAVSADLQRGENAMIYVPGRFLFVHIPRTGGMSITAALARALVGFQDCLIATHHHTNRPFVRHGRACFLKPRIPDWQHIAKVAIDRPYDAIVESDFRLHRREADRGVHEYELANSNWRTSVRLSMSESLDEFRNRRWVNWLGDDQPWEFWCCSDGNDLGVIRIPYQHLADRWPEICGMAGVRYVNLPHYNSA